MPPAAIRWLPATATGSSPQRWRCATGSSIAGCRARAATDAEDRKRVYYLSLEFLPGRLLLDSLNNAGLTEPMRLALAELGVDLDRLRAMEPDPALGNGGLGRLAACFMESMASLGIPAHGFGIRYNHGLFQQVIRDGWQHEYPGELAVASAIRGSSSGPTSATRSASAAGWNGRSAMAPVAVALASG